MTQNILPIFPTAIQCINNFIDDNERIEILNSIKKLNYENHHLLVGNASSTFLGKNLRDALKDKFIERLEDHINTYADKTGIPPVNIFNIWANIQNKGSILRPHIHPNSEISGALYLNVDSESSRLIFYNPNPHIKTHIYQKGTEFSFQDFWIKPKNGDLILFPGWLEHGSDENKSDERTVISFNATLRTLM